MLSENPDHEYKLTDTSFLLSGSHPQEFRLMTKVNCNEDNKNEFSLSWLNCCSLVVMYIN